MRKLVTMTICVFESGAIESDVQTHNNSYAEVARGLASVKAEIERVFAEASTCPYHPSTGHNPNTPVNRN